MTTPTGKETATLGGGCFWCIDAPLRELRGVARVESGYAGGSVDSPSYEAVCTGVTGHAEVVQVDFDPGVLPYRTLLEVFFSIHDPTTRDRQGADVGTQYRSVIFYHDESQRAAAANLIAELDAALVWDAPIVTDVVRLDRFWPAESYHQDYYTRHGSQPYCRMVISPKMAKLRQRHAALLRR